MSRDHDSFQVDILSDQVESSLNGLLNFFSDVDGLTIDDGSSLWDIFNEVGFERLCSLGANGHVHDFLKSFLIVGNDVHDQAGLQGGDLDVVVDSAAPTPVVDGCEGNDSECASYDSGCIKLSYKLDDLDLPEVFVKLIKRLRSASLKDQNFVFVDTVKDIIEVDLQEVARLSGVGRSYIQNLIDLQKELNEQLSSKKLASEIDQEIIKSDSEALLPLNLDDLNIPVRFFKLIKRLRSASVNDYRVPKIDNVSDVLALSLADIAKIPGVGMSYVDSLKDFKREIKNNPRSFLYSGSYPGEKAGLDFSKIDLSTMRLCLRAVDAKTVKSLKKLANYKSLSRASEALKELVFFDRNGLFSAPGIGGQAVDSLFEFSLKVRSEVQAIENGRGILDCNNIYVYPNSISGYSIDVIEQILLEDVDNYLGKISDDQVDIAQKRWGFVEEKKTLEEIASDHGVTRERVRQKEAKINLALIDDLRIGPETLWEYLETKLAPSFKNNMQSLCSCFSSEKDFYDFISLVCGQENLYKRAYPDFDSGLLNGFFAENGAPADLRDVREYVSELQIIGFNGCDHVIECLVDEGGLIVEGDFAWPRKLSKSEASACVLAEHPTGLPWADIARLVNNNGYSRSLVYEDRLDSEAMNNPDYIYLSGKGAYKHTKFIEFESLSLDDIFLEVLSYAENESRDVFHLMECYQASPYLRDQDYFAIRHFVKNFGEDYGLYFSGRSQADSVGLQKGFKNITQKEVIIEAMTRREVPLTKPEVAHLLKSKSRGHASFYLDGLIDEGKVVQVDRMLYTTPELAYRSISVADYISAIEDVLLIANRPVEPSVFKSEINKRFGVSYSKYFYASIARNNYKEAGWFRKMGLYSVSEIPFESLSDAVGKLCSLSASKNDNVENIKKSIAITDEAASIAINNFRTSLR